MGFYILLIPFQNACGQLLHPARFHGKIQTTDHISQIHLQHPGHIQIDLIQIHHTGQIQGISAHLECISQIQGVCR